MTTRHARRGFTLFELIVVMAILLLLAAVVLPSIGAFRGDTRQRAAADAIRGELAVARARAIEEGRPYRVAISEDKTRIRRAPDTPDFAQVSAFGYASPSSPVVEYAFENVTAQVMPDANGSPPAVADGWFTIGTLQPDGTCREDRLIAVKEDDNPLLYLRVRGLTGASRVVPASANGGAK